MPVKAIAKTSIARNGVGSFVRPCYRVTLQYCNWGGSSQGLRDLLSSKALDQMAAQEKLIVWEVKKVAGHPKAIFHYNNNKVNEVDLANLDKLEILKKVNEFSQRSGNDLFKYNHKVMSINESVRGVWSPLHEPKEHRHRI